MQVVCFSLIMLPLHILPLQAQTLRRGIDTLQLGGSLEEVQTQLQRSPYFFYRGPRDVSFLPQREETLIDTEGVRYIQRGIFQFQEGKLVSLMLYLNPKYLDYPTVFKHLISRYGQPHYLDPKSCYWMDEQTRIALEKPLTVKFVDRKILASNAERSSLEIAPEEVARRTFLELF